MNKLQLLRKSGGNITQLPPPERLGRAAEMYIAAKRLRGSLTRTAFILLVAVPTLLATIFYGLLASPRFVSDSTFVVRSVSSQRISGLDMFFRTFGIARTVDDGYVVQRYLQSRDVVSDLQKRGVDLKAIFTRPEGDRLSSYPRIWREESQESLYDFFLDRVIISEDSVKGLIELKVTTFRPDDSEVLAKNLLELAEGMVNRMNERAQSDATQRGQAEVDLAERTVLAAQKELTEFRNREILIDPGNSTMSLIETIGTLTTSLSMAQAELNQLQATSPTNPAIGALRARIASLEEGIRSQKAKMAGGDDALAGKVAIYEQLAMKRNLADTSLASALSALDVARQEAHRQHIYIEEVSAPSLPDESTEPRRVRSIITVFVFGFAIFAVVWILAVGAGEHAQ